jgi:cytochrome c-type biogenesis protein CcmH/NrfF
MKRHDIDPLSLVFGLLFAGLGLAFVIARVDITNTDLRWVWPLPLIVLGGLMIALGARRATEVTADDEEIPG